MEVRSIHFSNRYHRRAWKKEVFPTYYFQASLKISTGSFLPLTEVAPSFSPSICSVILSRVVPLINTSVPNSLFSDCIREAALTVSPTTKSYIQFSSSCSSWFYSCFGPPAHTGWMSFENSDLPNKIKNCTIDNLRFFILNQMAAGGNDL